jgi:selenide,water dikinase
MFDPFDHPDLLIGLDDPDDAAIWRLDNERVLVITTDFFTPVVDDAYEYGAIAAANALSDLYAMGGKPFLALTIAAFPPDLPAELLSEIIRGGAEMVRQSGAIIAGGHTIQDKEPKFGLVALGFAHPDKLMTKGGMKPGDQLVITKPLGFGVTTTALKRAMASEQDIVEVTRWMKTLNGAASELATAYGVKAATDVTGFSLIGHSHEMASASHCGIRFNYPKIPFISCAKKYADAYTFPGGAADNRLFFEEHVTYGVELEDNEKMLLFDPQTSGGLLLALEPDQFDGFMTAAKEEEIPVWQVGEAVEKEGITVTS